MERLRYVARARGTDPAVAGRRDGRGDRQPAPRTGRAGERCAGSSSSATRRAGRCGGSAPRCSPTCRRSIDCGTSPTRSSTTARRWQVAARSWRKAPRWPPSGTPTSRPTPLVRRGDVRVLAIDAGARRSRPGAPLRPRRGRGPPGARRVGAGGDRCGRLVLVEADACSPTRSSRIDGFGPRRGRSPRPRRRRSGSSPAAGAGCPSPIVDAIVGRRRPRAAPWDSEVESFPVSPLSPASPARDGVVDAAVAIPSPSARSSPELIRAGDQRDP